MRYKKNKRQNPYKIENESFLSEKAHYTGRLIDGTVFDSTEGEQLPALFRVRDLIMGWQIAQL